MTKIAILYRMVTAENTCPSGLKALDLLKAKGFSVEDHPLTSRTEIDAFKAEHDVKTTPQIFIDGKRVGGFTDLEAYFGETNISEATLSYRPVLTIFAVAALMAIALNWPHKFTSHSILSFIAIAMILLGLQKLQDLDKFAKMFLSYDLLAQKWPLYGYIYPFIETGAGLLMLANALTFLAAPVTFVAASIGAFSVFKAVYLDKRQLKCACVGGDKNVPLGIISLLENIMMIAMSIMMIAKM